MDALKATWDSLWGGADWALWLRAIVLFLTGLILAKVSSRFASHMAARKLGPHHVAIIRRFVFYSLFILFLISALRELGFQISVLLGAAGILSVAVGFASQTSASNLISGLFLLGERPFQVGDVIDVGGLRGEILAIDLLSLKLKTPDNLYVRIPNETLIKTNVINLTRFPLRRIDLIVGIAYRASVAEAKRVLLDIVDRDPRCLEEPKPFVIMSAFGASSVDLQLSFYVRKDVIMSTRSDVLETIKRRFEEAGIELPLPHTVLYAGSATQAFPIRLVTDAAEPAATVHLDQSGDPASNDSTAAPAVPTEPRS